MFIEKHEAFELKIWALTQITSLLRCGAQTAATSCRPPSTRGPRHSILPSPTLTRLLVSYHSFLISINRLVPPSLAGICSPCTHRASVSDSCNSIKLQPLVCINPPHSSPSHQTRRLDSPLIGAVPPKDFMTRDAAFTEARGE